MATLHFVRYATLDERAHSRVAPAQASPVTTTREAKGE
jgi:hypothetical protein